MSSQFLTFRFTAIPVQTVAYSSITSSFVAAGSAMPSSIRILKINNTTDADIYISYDGSTIHDIHGEHIKTGRGVGCWRSAISAQSVLRG